VEEDEVGLDPQALQVEDTSLEVPPESRIEPRRVVVARGVRGKG